MTALVLRLSASETRNRPTEVLLLDRVKPAETLNDGSTDYHLDLTVRDFDADPEPDVRIILGAISRLAEKNR